MDQQNRRNSQNSSTNQNTANIQLQQPIPTTSNTTSTKPTLDERIKEIISHPDNRTKRPSEEIDLTANRSKISTRINNTVNITENEPTTKVPRTSTTIPPPTLIPTKKPTHSFLQRFRAQNIDHQKPEYRKTASLPCDENPEKTINLYIFKEDKRPYEAADDHGKNKYKFGAGITSYFPTVEKVPNQMKFDNNWIHLLENIGTYNLYALLGKFDVEENIMLIKE